MTISVGSNLKVMVDGTQSQTYYEEFMLFLRAIDSLTQANVISASLAVPPTVNTNGDCYIIPTSASGVWAAHVGAIARWSAGRVSGIADGWEYFVPKKGWRVHVNNDTTNDSTTGNLFKYTGTAWVVVATGSATAAQMTINSQSGTMYTLALTDAANAVEMTNAATNYVTIPHSGDALFKAGDTILITQAGLGKTVIIPANVSVTLHNAHAGAAIQGQWLSAVLRCRAQNDWVIDGQLGV